MNQRKTLPRNRDSMATSLYVRLQTNDNTQGSHRNLIIIFHDFSLTISTVFHDARKEKTEDHRAYSSHIREESQPSFPTENRETKRCFASCLSL